MSGYRDIAYADSIARQVTDAFRMRAVAMRREGVRRAIAAAAVAHIADESTGDERSTGCGGGAKKIRLLRIERERDGKIEGALRIDSPLPALQRDAKIEMYGVARHWPLIDGRVHRLCATEPHAGQVRFLEDP